MKFVVFFLVTVLIGASVLADIGVKTSQSVYKSFQNIDVTYSGVTGENREYIALVEETAPSTTYGDWEYAGKNGKLTFEGKPIGKYEVRVLSNDKKILAKTSIEVVANDGPFITLYPGVETAPFAQVYKGGSNQEVIEISVLRVGDKEERTFLIKFSGTIDHPWNGKIIAHRQTLQYSRGQVSGEVYWTPIDGQRHTTIKGTSSGWSDRISYTVYIKDLGRGIDVHFSEDLTRSTKPADLLNQYLVATGQNKAIAEGKVQDTSLLYEKIRGLEKSVKNLKEDNSRIVSLENNIGKLKTELKDQKQQSTKELDEATQQITKLQEQNAVLLKQLDSAKKSSPVAVVKPEGSVNVTIARLLRYETNSYNRGGEYVKIYALDVLVNNYEKQKNAVVDASVQFWIKDKWEEGKLQMDRTPIPQYLSENAPASVSVYANIITQEKITHVKVQLTLFSGHTIENEFALSTK